MKITHLKIFVAMIVSFIVIKILINQIFIAGTPKINPVFLSRLRSFPKTIAALPGKIYEALQSSPKNTTIQPIQNRQSTSKYARRLPIRDLSTLDTVVKSMPLQPIAKDVYAGEDNKYDVSYLKIGENSQWEEIEYTAKDGKKYKLLRPKTN